MVADDPVEVAHSIRSTLGLDARRRLLAFDKDEAFRKLVDICEDAGILVMRSSVVGSNNTRKLSVKEFRGFALVDKYSSQERPLWLRHLPSILGVACAQK